MNIDEIIENFEFLDDWEDRYRYVIELGRGLTPLETKTKCRGARARFGFR